MRVGVTRDGRAANGVLRLLRAGRGGLVFARFHLRAIFRREDVLALQIFGGINVPRLFLLALLACTFLTGGFSNVLVLSIALRGTDSREREHQDAGNTKAQRTPQGPLAGRAADRGWGVEIRNCHCKPTTYGRTPLNREYTQNSFLEKQGFVE
ncbi:MAG: hypothetical protein AUH86_06600 [Acidobacteria bacterium 13_1_40CM_4_58_4]|nr:MAG: hypothetical protein AUH86_06600 [Acidobacteria bacterium 13_1_40CM_4_58_4]